LLNLPLEKLSLAHRDLILKAVSPRLGGLIQNSDELQRLLALPLEKLSLAHRDLILESFGPRFFHIIKTRSQLKQLFNFKFFDIELRPQQITRIIFAIRYRITQLLDSEEELKELFLVYVHGEPSIKDHVLMLHALLKNRSVFKKLGLIHFIQVELKRLIELLPDQLVSIKDDMMKLLESTFSLKGFFSLNESACQIFENKLERLSSQNFAAAAVFFDRLATTDAHDEHSPSS
jgi:hypothetical protein